MLILGLNAFHGDASACVLKDGYVLAAAEEERFLRIKHWAGFPVQAISWCLKEAGVTIADVEIIALNSNPKARLWAKIGYTLAQRPKFSYLLERLNHRRQRLDLRQYFAAHLQPLASSARIYPVEHHRTHLASAFYCSPFTKAAVMSIDGFGDFCSTAWGIGSGTEIKTHKEVLFPHSLGIFYQAMTQYLGFPAYGDEYKIMGLAPYGKAEFKSEMAQLIHRTNDGYELDLKYFRHHREKMNFQWHDGVPKFDALYSQDLEELFGPARRPGSELTQRHKDLAYCVQDCYESVVFDLLAQWHKTTGLDDLALAGGCAMNSVANGRLYDNTGFRRVYVQPAAGDAGGALGAALCAQADSTEGLHRSPMLHAAWGPQFTNDEINVLLKTQETELIAQAVQICQYDAEGLLCEAVASLLSEGGIVGWFQGRMEWGPRALGQRSILADPRRGDMREILNLKIKRRESFRPFAPSILRECVGEWFEYDADVPFMMKVFTIRAERRDQVPAVTHVDGSGRLQTVSREHNERYYRLIKCFATKTGVPMLLNTSFNENEPIVCRPQEALDCFLRTGMDCLVLNDFVLRRAKEQ